MIYQNQVFVAWITMNINWDTRIDNLGVWGAVSNTRPTLVKTQEPKKRWVLRPLCQCSLVFWLACAFVLCLVGPCILCLM
jgi:hypothetical protein